MSNCKPLYLTRRNFFNSWDADPKPGYNNARYYAIQITASHFSDKPRDASASIARSCDCEFAGCSYITLAYISETVRASAIVTMECEYEVISDPSNGVISNDLE